MNSVWTGNESVYHIYPLSFADSNGDGYGDLKGIISRLDHLGGADGALGVDAIWLSPIYPSPFADFGYDVADYRGIDPRFGTMADFDRLIAAAHERSIKVMLDFVLNHTSDRHPWFIAARASKKSATRDWYVWRDPAPGGGPPNNWLSVFGGPAWTFDGATGQYYLHSFLPDQPDLNWRNPRVVAEMESTLRFWLKRGVDGFRLDAMYHLMKDRRFRDERRNPKYRHGTDEPYGKLIHDRCQRLPETFGVMRRLSRIAGKNGAFMVGEAYLDVRGMREFFRRVDRRSYAPMNFNLIGLPWDAAAYRRFVDAFEKSLPKGAVPTYVLGNHDRARVATRLPGGRARVAATMLLTLRGMPFVYYGDELGMRDVTIKPGTEQDPFGIRVTGFRLGRDPQRSPMQWTPGAQAGFTTGTPWLPVSDDKTTVNVETESSDPASMLSLHRTLLALRRSVPALREGSYRSLRTKPGTYAFVREKGRDAILVASNFTRRPISLSLPRLASGRMLCDSSTRRKPGEPVDLKRLTLPPDAALVIAIDAK